MVDTPDSATETQQALRLLVKGFSGFDQRLLDGVVKLSQRRNPSLELVDSVTAAGVDVVMIDGKDAQAVAWAHSQQTWLARQAVVWVDAQHELPASHTGLKRPVQWTNLPVILSRAMDDAAHHGDYTSAAPASSSLAAAASKAPASLAADKQGLAAAAARLDASAHHAAPPATAQSATAQAQAPHQHHQAQPQAAAAASAASHPPGQAPSILVVDDSAAVRGHLESALKTVGYDVSSVDSGEAAIMAVGARAYACILMDVLMPGIDGYEACRKIKAMPPSGNGQRPAIVMLTSKSSPFDRIRGKMAGCDAYLTKPVQRSHLMQVLAEHAFKNLKGAA